MKFLYRYRVVLSLLAAFAGFFIFLQINFSFHYFFIEQNQLFQNTWNYVSEYLTSPGGLSLMLSESVVQFFIYPYMGAAIMAILFTAAAALSCILLRRIAPSMESYVLSLLPPIALMFVHLDFNYQTSGTVSYIFALATACGVFSIKSFNIRAAVHFVAVLFLYYTAGAVFILYTVIAVVWELFGDSPRRYLILLLPVVGLLVGLLSVYFSVIGDYRLIFLPDGYYHTSLKPKPSIYFSWLVIVGLVLVAGLMKNRKTLTVKRAWAERCVVTIAVAVFFVWGTGKYRESKSSYIVKKFDYYSRTGQWDKILEGSKGPLKNYLLINYVNLALMEKGELCDRMFSFDQHGYEGLISNWDKTSAVSVLHSDIYYAMNIIGSSQEMAFEATVSAMGAGNPRMMMRLVETNLIYGSYPVAEKYIDLLENTFAYSRWAKEQRKFLNDDIAVNNDPRLGLKRKALPDSVGLMNNYDTELLLVDANLSGQKSAAYAGGLYLLNKDIVKFQTVLDTYYGSPALPKLPVAFQEAIILMFEKDREMWEKYKVSEAVVRRFAEFRKQVVAANQSGNVKALPTTLKQSLGDTYWYYYMF